MILDHKKLDLFGKLLFEKAILEPPFNRPVPMPNEACFLYVKSGIYKSTSEEEEFFVHENETVLMKCGNFMGQMLSSYPGQRYEAIAIHFYPEVLKKVYDNALPSFLKDYNYSFHSNMVKMKATILVRKYIESILFYFENPQLVTEDILILKLKEIILLLLQTGDSPRVIEILTNLFSEKIFSFKEVIEAHICSHLTIQELVTLTHHSLSSFKRKFKQIYSDTPANYLRARRLEKARQLLSISDQ